MKARTLYLLAALVFVGGPLFLAQQPIIAAIFAMGLLISWQVHVLEVKINRLLDQQRIHVSNEEINT